MAEKFTAKKLMNICTDFLHANIGHLVDTNVLDELFLEMPLVAKLCLQKQQKTIEIASRVLGVKHATSNLATSFKKRKDFNSDLEYKDYMMENIKPNMLVHCNKDSAWEGLNVKEGTIGRVTQSNINDGPVVRWSTDYCTRHGSFLHLDLLSTPIKIDWLHR